MGSVATSSNQVNATDGYNQMKLDGWNSIKFNWSGNGKDRLYLYGCNTAKDQSGLFESEYSFASLLSIGYNMKGVTVFGQPNTAYPSDTYDSRLARRWNTDPKMKTFLSPYSVFRNSPLLYVDPNGDDDFFDKNGNFLGSTKEGNAIRVVNSNETFDYAKENIPNCTVLLAEIDYNPKNIENRAMLASIATFYAKQAGIEENILVGEHDPETQGAVGAYWHSIEKRYFISVSKETGLINQNLSESGNMVNTWVHEKTHKDDPTTHTPLNHVNSILAQVKDKSFEKVTEEFKIGQLMYASILLNRAIKQGATMEAVNKKIDEVNNSKLGDTGLLIYDEQTKTVSAIIAMPEIEVKPK